MTRIQFYILKPGSRDNRFGLACRVTEIAYRRGHRVLMHTESAEQAQHLDRLLWTFREQSFLPHGQIADADASLTPVLIDHQGNAGDEHDVLVNLTTTVPGFFSRFERVLECIDHEPEIKAAGRQRFRYYRDHGYPLENAEID